MLRTLKDLESLKVTASDGEIGVMRDLCFDDAGWTVRYVVVETGSWLARRRVLISTLSVQQSAWTGKALPVAVSMDQVRRSPDIDTDRPVSRQSEERCLGHYGHPHYWDGGGPWGEGLHPAVLAPEPAGPGHGRELEAALRAEAAGPRDPGPTLRSGHAFQGSHVQASDGAVGPVSGFLVDDATWAIRYLIVDTGSWSVGQKVLIAPPWIRSVQWAARTLAVDFSRAAIRKAAPYDATAGWSREQEQHLHRHYGRSGYWAGLPLLETVI